MSLSANAIRTCFVCGSDAHLKRDCQVQKERMEKICNYCKNPGHLIRNCEKLRKKEQSKKHAEQPSQVNLWTNIVKKTGDPLVLAQVEVDNKLAEAEEIRKKEKQRQFAIARHQRYLEYLERRQVYKERANAGQITKMENIRGEYWFMHTEGTADEYFEKSKYDIREIAGKLRYDYEMKKELDDMNEELQEERLTAEYRKNKTATRAYYKSILSEEEFDDWCSAELNDLFEEMNDEHYHAITTYTQHAPTEYAIHCMRTGELLDYSMKPFENRRRNNQIGKR